MDRNQGADFLNELVRQAAERPTKHITARSVRDALGLNDAWNIQSELVDQGLLRRLEGAPQRGDPRIDTPIEITERGQDFLKAVSEPPALTADPVDSTFATHEIPILRAAVRGLLQAPVPGFGPNVRELAAATGLPAIEVANTLKGLEDAGHVGVSWMSSDASRVEHVSAEARQLAGQWPSPEGALATLTRALEQMAETTGHPAQAQAQDALAAFRGAGAAFEELTRPVVGDV